MQNSERQPYDVVRQALREVELDSSRRVELDDYVDVRDSVSKLCLVAGKLTRRVTTTAHRPPPRVVSGTEAHIYRSQTTRLSRIQA